MVPLLLVDHVSLSKSISPQTEVVAEEMKRLPYAFKVVSLMYVMVSYRLNLAHVASQVSMFMAHPCKAHWQALKGISKYLVGIVNVDIFYGQKGEVEGCSNI